MERPDRPVTTWRKSTYSGGNGSNCVEVSATPDSVLVRDTKNRVTAVLTIAPVAWAHFAGALKA